MNRNQQIAADILKAIGGGENVTFATHCMTRLRLNFKDESLVNDDEVKAIDGVIGVAKSGGQYQIIIGQNVSKVYPFFCEQGGIAMQAAVDENVDAPKEKLTLKSVGGAIMNYVSGSVVQMIPLLIVAGLCKALLAIVGPDLLGIAGPESGLYITLDFLYDAGFYFFPIYLGYTAASKLKASPILGLMLGGILLAPDFMAMAGTQFKLFGFLPCTAANYSSTLIPILLSVWVMSIVEKYVKKISPEALSTMMVPFLTIMVMVPLELCILAPLGSFLSNYLSIIIMAISAVGFLSSAVLGAVWQFVVITGMHMPLLMIGVNSITTAGVDYAILPAAFVSCFAGFGMAFGGFLRIKNKKEKSMALSYFLSGIFGGINEPVLYGLGLKYKKPLIGMVIGGFCGGLYFGLTHVGYYAFGASNFLLVLSFIGGGNNASFINGIIGCVIAFVVATAVTFIFGFDKNDPVVTQAE